MEKPRKPSLQESVSPHKNLTKGLVKHDKHFFMDNKKSHKLGGTRLGKMDQQEVNFSQSPAESPAVALRE